MHSKSPGQEFAEEKARHMPLPAVPLTHFADNKTFTSPKQLVLPVININLYHPCDCRLLQRLLRSPPCDSHGQSESNPVWQAYSHACPHLRDSIVTHHDGSGLKTLHCRIPISFLEHMGACHQSSSRVSNVTRGFDDVFTCFQLSRAPRFSTRYQRAGCSSQIIRPYFTRDNCALRGSRSTVNGGELESAHWHMQRWFIHKRPLPTDCSWPLCTGWRWQIGKGQASVQLTRWIQLSDTKTEADD